ncbi:hypothetical protein DEO72_LG3g1853 [Vigna unguiculata]|uniref:Uncharacterized protein n=1 Tax=Vigna unguiculata TaxID=3917 RepID=A0A4D6LF95_VIGUN|nr:hypothetical protein DEO72_LG3g1853 [Vigna unguiculata]
MDGIRKTTVGRALYERISHQYDFHYFIDDFVANTPGYPRVPVDIKKLCGYPHNGYPTNLDTATGQVFIQRKNVRNVKEVLEFRGFHHEYGLQVLIEKSLITYICEFREMNIWLINMHDLLVDLGKCIVGE